MKHTPGKWIVRKWDGEQWPERRWSVSVDEGDISKAICISPKYFTHEPESLANAELIARAPSLLEENESLKAINKQLLESLKNYTNEVNHGSLTKAKELYYGLEFLLSTHIDKLG